MAFPGIAISFAHFPAPLLALSLSKTEEAKWYLRARGSGRCKKRRLFAFLAGFHVPPQN